MPLCFRTCTLRGILEMPRAIMVRAFMYRAFLGKKLELEPLSNTNSTLKLRSHLRQRQRERRRRGKRWRFPRAVPASCVHNGSGAASGIAVFSGAKNKWKQA